VQGLGFRIGNEFTLLGMKISRDLRSLTDYFEEVIVRVQRLAEYWNRFRLTLPGRILICKTFLLSQIGYLGAIIAPSLNQTKRLQEIMDDFCLSSLRIAKKKMYTPTNEGGLGLINIKNYITALQCSWVKRVLQHWGDNWRYDIKKAGYGNPLIVNNLTFDSNIHPVLAGICSSFGKFATAYYRKDKNYLKAHIFNNPLFRRGRDDERVICENFFGRNYDRDDLLKIALLKFEDFFVRGRAKSLDNLVLDTGIHFNLNTYLRIHESLQFYSNKVRNLQNSPSVSLEIFMKSFTKGSKPYRRIFRTRGQ
jgi:hypothetical protein